MCKSIKILSSILLAGLAVSCSLPHEPGPQPTTLLDTDSSPSIVIFAVFRPDSGMSFLEVGGSFTMEEANNESLPWPKPTVTVIDSATGEVFDFVTALDDTSYNYWYSDYFAAQVGHTYQVTVTAEEYDPLTGSTTVPDAPQFDYVELSNEFHVLITSQPNIHGYEVHLTTSDGEYYIKTTTANGDEKLPVAFGWSDKSVTATNVVVYGYERNLSEYLNTTISIKPGAYQPQKFYVEGGYGVVGALNFTQEHLIQ